MSDIYEKLRARLDELATGYPATESRVEIRRRNRRIRRDAGKQSAGVAVGGGANGNGAVPNRHGAPRRRRADPRGRGTRQKRNPGNRL